MKTTPPCDVAVSIGKTDDHTSKPCSIRDGLFLEPCWGLSTSVHGPASKSGGLHIRRMTSFVTMKPARTYAVVRRSAHRDENDIVLNNCPFCGVKIDAPALDMEDVT